MKEILNPFVYIKEYRDYSLIYVPYEHLFFIFRDKIDLKKNKEFLLKNRILVEPDYKERFIKNYQKIVNSSEPELNLMYLLLTDRCNFNCPYCFIENNYSEKERSFLKLEDAEKAIDYFFKNSSSKEQRIIFYGGEPLLNKDVLIKAIEKIRKISKTAHIGINTNGSSYDEKLSKVFKENRVVVSISLDGFEKINDKTRIDYALRGTSKKVFRNIDNYINDGVIVSFSVTINSFNIDYLPAISKWIVDRFPSVKSIGFNLPLENLKGNNLMVDFEYCAFQIYNSYRILRRFGVYEDRVLRRLRHIVNEEIYLKDCGACGNQIVVHPSGKLGQCHGFSGTKEYFDYDLDNLNFKDGETFKRWNLLSLINKKYCIEKNCPFILICGNSCPYYSKITRGSLDEPDDRMFPFLTVLIEEIGKDLYLSPPQAIAIDYDGTIISREPSYDVIKYVAGKYGYEKEIPKKDFYDIRKIFNEIGNEINKKEKVNEMINLYLKKWKENSQLNAPLINQLKKIKEKYMIPVYILSKHKKEDIIKELKELKIDSLFDDVFESENFDKPSKEYYKEFFDKINKKPEEIVYIGDSYASDIKPIYSFGIRGAISFYANKDYFSELGNDWLLDIFDDYFKLEKDL